MHAMLGKMTATEGNGDVLAERMLQAARSMREVPGCRQYFIYRGEGEDIWISEFWDSQEAHEASLQNPATQAFIAETMPLIAGFDVLPVTPLGGIGPFD